MVKLTHKTKRQKKEKKQNKTKKNNKKKDMKNIKKFEQYSAINESIVTPQTIEEVEEIIANMTKDSAVDDTVSMRLFIKEHPEWKKATSEGGKSKEWAQVILKWSKKLDGFYTTQDEEDEALELVNRKFAEISGTEYKPSNPSASYRPAGNLPTNQFKNKDKNTFILKFNGREMTYNGPLTKDDIIDELEAIGFEFMRK